MTENAVKNEHTISRGIVHVHEVVNIVEEASRTNNVWFKKYTLIPSIGIKRQRVWSNLYKLDKEQQNTLHIKKIDKLITTE